MTAREFIADYSGFFNDSPTHDDVADYFTRENFAAMFGEHDADLPDGLTWEILRATAHDMIDEDEENDQ